MYRVSVLGHVCRFFLCFSFDMTIHENFAQGTVVLYFLPYNLSHAIISKDCSLLCVES